MNLLPYRCFCIDLSAWKYSDGFIAAILWIDTSAVVKGGAGEIGVVLDSTAFQLGQKREYSNPPPPKE